MLPECTLQFDGVGERLALVGEDELANETFDLPAGVRITRSYVRPPQYVDSKQDIEMQDV